MGAGPQKLALEALAQAQQLGIRVFRVSGFYQALLWDQRRTHTVSDWWVVNPAFIAQAWQRACCQPTMRSSGGSYMHMPVGAVTALAPCAGHRAPWAQTLIIRV